MRSVEKRLVKPFYLKMMGLNALRNAAPLWEDLAKAGKSATIADVRELLAPDHWRPVVMGAWFSLRFSADEVGDELLGAVSRCRGTLTAPPLSVAAAVVLGRDSDTSLAEYVERDLSQQQGAAGFVSAVREHTSGHAIADVLERDREALRGLLDVAQRLRHEISG